jgi:MATE family multidrug resistance protein
LSWPVIVANVTIPLVGVVDTAVMGRMPDPAYIGAVAVGSTIFSAIYWIFGFLRMATTGLTAQAAGAGLPREVSRVAARSLCVALALAATILALQIPLESLVFRIFDASFAVESFARTYFTIRIWGAPALMIHMVVLGVLFGTQRVRATLMLSVLLNVTNVVLDLLFVLDFGWGVAGVAAATLISEWLAALVGLIVVIGGLRATNWQRDWFERLWAGAEVVRLFGVSGNLIVRSFFVQFPFFVFTVVGAKLGDLVLAANAVVMQFFFIMAFGLDGFAHTVETLSGYAYGARNARGLRQAVVYSLEWACGLSVLIALTYWLAGPLLIGVLTVLPDVREAATNLLPWAIAAPVLSVLAFHMDGVYIGTTRTAELRNSMFFATCLFLMVLWAALDRLGNHGLWLALCVFLFSRGILLGARYPRIEQLLAQRSRQ